MESGSIEANSTDNGLSDALLVAQVIAGDRKAFDDLIRRYQRQAVAVSYRLLGNSQDALEVTQDAFLKAFSSIATLTNPAAFGGWLMRIVSNLSLNHRRSRKNQSRISFEEVVDHPPPSGSGDPVRQLQSREMGDRLAAAMKSLPEKQRLAIVMFAIEGMPQLQVAEAMQCSVEAVKWHVFQGRKKLKELLRDDLQD